MPPEEFTAEDMLAWAESPAAPPASPPAAPEGAGADAAAFEHGLRLAEALIFASDRPVAAARLQQVLDELSGGPASAGPLAAAALDPAQAAPLESASGSLDPDDPDREKQARAQQYAMCAAACCRYLADLSWER